MRKPKKPKRPKMSASLATWQNWERKMQEWKKRVQAIEQAPAKKRSILNKYR